MQKQNYKKIDSKSSNSSAFLKKLRKIDLLEFALESERRASQLTVKIYIQDSVIQFLRAKIKKLQERNGEEN